MDFHFDASITFDEKSYILGCEAFENLADEMGFTFGPIFKGLIGKTFHAWNLLKK